MNEREGREGRREWARPVTGQGRTCPESFGVAHLYERLTVGRPCVRVRVRRNPGAGARLEANPQGGWASLEAWSDEEMR